jgi:hypothetical protein
VRVSDLTPGRVELAVAAALGAELPARCRVGVDLSRMDNSSRRAVSYEDCDRPIPAIGDVVDAVDLIGRLEATAEVVGIDEGERLVRVAIDWRTVRESGE